MDCRIRAVALLPPPGRRKPPSKRELSESLWVAAGLSGRGRGVWLDCARRARPRARFARIAIWIH
jgi:hypothetical protein